MAENFTVVWNAGPAGDATAGFKWENQTEAKCFGNVEKANVVIVNAGSAQEAITGVRKAYGDGMVTGEMKVAKTSSVETKAA